MSSEPKLEPGKYSMFVLEDEHTWLRPTVRTLVPMTQSDIEAMVLDHYRRKYFIALGFDTDEECPDDQLVLEIDDEGVRKQ